MLSHLGRWSDYVNRRRRLYRLGHYFGMQAKLASFAFPPHWLVWQKLCLFCPIIYTRLTTFLLSSVMVYHFMLFVWSLVGKPLTNTHWIDPKLLDSDSSYWNKTRLGLSLLHGLPRRVSEQRNLLNKRGRQGLSGSQGRPPDPSKESVNRSDNQLARRNWIEIENEIENCRSP